MDIQNKYRLLLVRHLILRRSNSRHRNKEYRAKSGDNLIYFYLA